MGQLKLCLGREILKTERVEKRKITLGLCLLATMTQIKVR